MGGLDTKSELILDRGSVESARTTRLYNLSVGKCTCMNIRWGPGVGVKLRGQSELPFPFSELDFLELAFRQPACPLNRRVVASAFGLLASARPGGVEFDKPY